MATKLEQKREELNAKRKELSEIFEKYPELDMPKDVAVDIKQRNDELTALGKEFDELKAMAAIDDENRKAQEAAGARQSLPMNRQGEGGFGAPQAQKSIGQLFVESAAYKQYNRVAKRSPAVEIEAPHLFEQKVLLTEVGFVPATQRTGLILPGALRRPMVADLIPQGRTSRSQVTYMEETTTTNLAAPVPEGGLKPESELAFTERNSPVRKIATVLPITDELLEDEPAVQDYVEQRLRVFLALAEENQLMNGTGVAPQILGLMDPALVTNAQPLGADPVPDAIYKGMTLVQINSFLDPDGVIMHPTDWQDIRLLRTVDGIYIWGSPSEAGPERIWGLPVVKTTAATLGTAVVAAFGTAMQIFRRNEVSFAISTEHADFFIRNQLMLRVEERLAFVVYRPLGITRVTGI
jgi:HK97 family phage major capsid protein